MLKRRKRRVPGASIGNMSPPCGSSSPHVRSHGIDWIGLGFTLRSTTRGRSMNTQLWSATPELLFAGRLWSRLAFGGRTAWTRSTLRPGRTQFLAVDFAVVVFIELFQCGRGVGNFLFVKNAVVVRIQHRHDRHHKASSGSRPRPSGVGPPFARRTIRWRCVLGEADRGAD